MHYEKGLATQDHAGESIACAAANAMKFHLGGKTGNPQIPDERHAHVELNMWGGYVVGHAVNIEVTPEGVIVRNEWGEPPFMVRHDQFETKDPEV